MSLHLGYNEQEKEAKHLALHQMFTQDPSLQPMYSMENRYNMMKKVLEAQGIKMLMLILHHQTRFNRHSQTPTGNADADGSEAVGIAGTSNTWQNSAMTDAQIAAARLQLDGEKAQSQLPCNQTNRTSKKINTHTK